jgi:Domain of unknown function (DUF3854)
MDYRSEWQKSCVDEELIDLNVTPLKGLNSLDYLLYSDQLPRNNDGRVNSQILKRYEHTTDGGWWCSGLDVLTGKEDLWGCFKPVHPRTTDDAKKIIKYEHPPMEKTGLFALRVPPKLWEKIARKNHLEFSPAEHTNFWSWLIANPSVPLCITEGAKKAGTLLSAGYPAIALPGVNNGYRTPKDNNGRKIAKAHLIPQIQLFAQPGRDIYIIFDQDSRAKSIKAVNAAIAKMGGLLVQAKCKVKVVTWASELGKGVDDLIGQQGQAGFDAAYQKATSFDAWKAHSLGNLTYSANLEINSTFLPKLEIPANTNLVAIKSPQGTGKTQFLATIVQKAISQSRPVLVIGHRIKLVEELCQRFGIEYISQIEQKNLSRAYGLCIDSLHADSKAQFDPHEWSDALVILDEVEQVFWHALNSSTCSSNRVAILQSLKQLVQQVTGGGGQIFIADADLSDVSLDYLIALSEIELSPYVIVNRWLPKPEQTYPVYYYQENTPKRILKDLTKELQNGGKAFVCLSAQQLKSQWGTLNLESYLKQELPKLKILRIDSESLSEPEHPAYNCLNNLNDLLPSYDIVLASPSIETGVSIDIRGHFTSVWGIAQGVQSATSVCQALGRVRENIPRHLWAAPYGFNKVGNGATSLAHLLNSGERLTQLNIRLLQQSDIEGWDEVNTQFQAESLLCWAKMAIRVNVSMLHYRESILNHLSSSGHPLIDSKNKKIKPTLEENQQPKESLSEIIKVVQQENYLAQSQSIIKAPLLTEQEYQNLKKSPIKSPQQRFSLRKYILKQRYGIPITVELIERDDKGWYPKLRLNYFLTVGRSYLTDRDALVAQKILQQGNGTFFLPDFNNSQLGASVGVLEILGLPDLLRSRSRELSNHEPDIQTMSQLALRHRQEIKAVTGVGITQNATPMLILRQLLSCIGYSLNYIRARGSGQNRTRIYQIAEPQDDREKIFAQWLRRDMSNPGSSEPQFLEEIIPKDSTPKLSSLPVQLTIDL